MDNKVMFAVMGLGAVGLFFYVKESSAAKSAALPSGAKPAQLPAPGASVPGNIPSTPNVPNVPGLPNASSTSPEFQAAQSAAAALLARFPGGVPAANDNSPEAQAARNLLNAFPQGIPPTPASTATPEAQAALGFLNSLGSLGVGIVPEPFQPKPGRSADVVNVGDIVSVDMFRSGMNLPQNVPLVGLIFMNVDGLLVPGDLAHEKLIASFVSPEFRVFGPQTVNRSSIASKV